MDDTNKAVAAASTPVSTNAAKYTGPVIYIGPGFRDSRLNHCMIFADGIPDSEANDDVLKHLFVTPAELNQALSDVQIKGTALYTFYQMAVNRRKGGK